VSTNERRRDRARISTRKAVASIVGDVRQTRISIGLSIASAAASVGLHRSTFGRIERNELEAVTVEQLALACAAVGNQLVLRSYPANDPAHDAGQLRLLTRFRARLPATISLQTEVPLPIPGDPRALDGMVPIGPARIGVEAETKLGDIQAVDRRGQLKRRDARLDRFILLVADTRGNRQVLEQHREALRANYPLDTKAVLAALARSEVPEADGIVVL
jgi:transcriptional regulator with XRE-family HTH domain